MPELLRASHIKPWAACESDAERLDVFNGLLLAPHLDAAFDRGFITVADDGEVAGVQRARPTGVALCTAGYLGSIYALARSLFTWRANALYTRMERLADRLEERLRKELASP